jgi:hypothetical protein
MISTFWLIPMFAFGATIGYVGREIIDAYRGF